MLRYSGNNEFKVLGTSKHCLNLGSYNYLGFAAADPYCTPRVKTTLDAHGNTTGSARVAAGWCMLASRSSLSLKIISLPSTHLQGWMLVHTVAQLC